MDAAPEKERIVDFDPKLMQKGGERTEIPEQNYDVIARLWSPKFQKTCRNRFFLCEKGDCSDQGVG